jgi:membrane protease YdiL (CAAX protease family)
MTFERADAPASPCTPWGVWATLAWGAAALAAWFGAQVGFAAVALMWFGGDDGDLAGNALVVAIVTIGAVPPALAVIALAARTARCGIVEYLALRWPARRDLLIGLVCLAVLIPVVDLISMFAGRDVAPGFVTDLYRNARDAGTLPLLVLALVVAAPLVEESLFRGLLLPGLAASRLGPAGAIALTSAGWTVMHLQYEPFYLMQALALGVTFGWMRWRSGSTVLAILLHGIVNLTSVIQAAVIVEWLS